MNQVGDLPGRTRLWRKAASFVRGCHAHCPPTMEHVQHRNMNKIWENIHFNLKKYKLEIEEIQTYNLKKYKLEIEEMHTAHPQWNMSNTEI